MSQYGSLNNAISARSTIGAPTPEVGMGATQLCWSDRHAYTIVSVSKSGKRIEVQRDKAIRVDGNGMSEAQRYEFEADPSMPRVTLSLRKNGQWKSPGGNVFAIGYRSEYHDFSF